MIRETLYSKLNRIAEIENDEERAKALRSELLQDNMLAIVVQRVYHPNYNFDLPKGGVPGNARKSNHDEPGPFLQSLRRWDILRTNEEVPYNSNIKEGVKVQQFIGFYEGVSSADADLLIAVNEKKLPWDNLNEEFVVSAIPELFPDSFRGTAPEPVATEKAETPASSTTVSKGNAKQQCIEIMQKNPGLKRKDYLALFEKQGIKKATAAIYYQELKDTI